jgi:hypothetical protein
MSRSDKKLEIYSRNIWWQIGFWRKEHIGFTKNVDLHRYISSIHKKESRILSFFSYTTLYFVAGCTSLVLLD